MLLRAEVLHDHATPAQLLVHPGEGHVEEIAPGSRALPAVRIPRRGPELTFYFGLKRPEAKAIAAFCFALGAGSYTLPDCSTL